MTIKWTWAKWADRTTATYSPINETRLVNGLQQYCSIDGRLSVCPNFPPVTRTYTQSDADTYYRFSNGTTEEVIIKFED